MGLRRGLIAAASLAGFLPTIRSRISSQPAAAFFGFLGLNPCYRPTLVCPSSNFHAPSRYSLPGCVIRTMWPSEWPKALFCGHFSRLPAEFDSRGRTLLGWERPGRIRTKIRVAICGSIRGRTMSGAQADQPGSVDGHGTPDLRMPTLRPEPASAAKLQVEPQIRTICELPVHLRRLIVL
jgi:hypothetical protein